MEGAGWTVPWQEIDTVLVDMDGTVLDLAFDNFFWLELVPSHYAKLHGLEEEEARSRLLSRYRAAEGTLTWYCIDHWSEDLGLDIRALKWANRHRITYLPRAVEFLASVRARGKQLLIVTNAHRETLAVKVSQTRLNEQVDDLVCSHDFMTPKETPRFWGMFEQDRNFDRHRTLLIEDSLRVLENARAFGLRFTLAIQRPDSRHPPRVIDSFPAVDGVHELLGSS